MPVCSRLAALCATAMFAAGAYAQGVLVDVVEFYNATLDHYFISASSADIQALDSGKFAGWSRTGQGFKAYDAPADGTSPVCRFYLPPAVGDSHFYSASPAECAEVAAKFPNFVYESPSVMHAGLPDTATGGCRAGWNPVYRMWNTRADSNHRYTTDTAVRDAMLAKGYVAEGYGPAGVAMCAASPAPTYELTLTAASVLLLPGETRDVYATITPRNGYSGAVALAAADLPAGVAVQLSPTSVTVGPGAVSAVLRLTAALSAPATAVSAAVTVSGSDSNSNTVLATFSMGVATAGDPVAVRLSAIAAVEERARQLSGQGLSGLPLVQAVAAFMATRPEYKASGVDVETISAWGRFSDGRPHVVAANRTPAPGAPGFAPSALSVKSGAEVPKETRARLLHTFGRNFEGQAPIDEMRGYLRGKDWNVRPGAEGQANVATLQSTSGDGFFYINTHGARIDVDDANEPDGKIYAIQSSTVVSGELDKVFEKELAALELVHFTALNGEKIVFPGFPPSDATDTRYAITYRFVKAHMSFARDSVVLINACFSSRNVRFKDAFLQKGAGVYLGWSELLSKSAAYESAPYFVDRMLGANQHPTKESPPQRAFPYDLVLQDMAKKGLTTDKVTGGALQATAAPGLSKPPIFAPSIRYVQVDEDAEKITLVGEFDSDLPKVTVGGIAIPPESWSPEKIVVPLRQNGPGSSGDVIVEVRGVKSNARQLTEWSIPLTYLWTDAGGKTGWQVEGSGTVRLRADVGAHRVVPGEVPKYIPRGGPLTKDSSLKLTGSGSFANGGCTDKLSGTSSHDRQGGYGSGIGLSSRFVIAGDTRRGSLGLLMAVPAIRIMNIRTGSSTGCSGSSPFLPTFGKLDAVVSLPGDQSDNPVQIPYTALEFTLDANFAIPAKTKTTSDAGGALTVSWTGAIAKTPPRDTDDAGK